MQPDNTSARLLNTYIYVAIVLGLMVGILTVLPNFVGPELVRRQATLQLVARTTPVLTPQPATPTATTSPSPAPACRSYTVQPGDTLFGLAQRFGTTAMTIALNNDLRSDVLAVGQILVICSAEQPPQPTPPAPTPTPTVPAELEEPLDVVMSLTYPRDIHNRKPHWITLSIERPDSVGVTGIGLLPDVVEATTLDPVTLPAPHAPRVPADQRANLIERWLTAQLTGSHVTLRSQPMHQSQALSTILSEEHPLVWQWLFAPPEAGDFLFGLDVFTSGEFELLDATGNLVGTVRTEREAAWSHDFTVSVDEIFGIPRQWWVLVSGLGAVMSLLVGLVQIAAD